MKMKHIAALVAALAVSSLSVVSMSAYADNGDTTKLKSSYTFKMGGGFGSENDWSAENHSLTVDHDGTYSFEWPVAEATESTDSCTLFIDTDVDLYAYDENGDVSKTGITFTIDSVTADGNPIAYNFSNGSLRAGDNGQTLRMNLRNQWGNCFDLDYNFTVQEKLVVNFTVSGLFPTPEESSKAEDSSAAESSKAADDSSKSDSSAAASSSAASSTAASSAAASSAAETTSNASTGDKGIAVALAGLAVAGAVVLVSRKKD